MKEKFLCWLQIVFNAFSIIGVIFLVLYTRETFLIRKLTEKQQIISVRPYLAFLSDPSPYTIINKSNNVAQNIFQISRLNGQYFLSDEESVGGLAPNEQKHIDKNKNKKITESELKTNIPSIAKLIDYLDRKQIAVIVVIYEDLFGNKLFSAFYGSTSDFDISSETAYIQDLSEDGGMTERTKF